MAFNYESEFIFIGKGDESFLENYSYELSEDPEGFGGKIFMALEILNNPAEAEDIGEAMFANFKQKFYEDLKADPYQRFEEALKAVNVTVETLKEEKVSRFVGNFNVAMGAVTDGTLYISTAGDADVYLIRKRFVSIVSEGLAEESDKEVFVNIANGSIENGDCIVFSSSRLLRYITKGELGRIFSVVGPGQIGPALSELQDFIMTEILGRSAIVGVYSREELEAPVVGGEPNIFGGESKSFVSTLLDQFNKVLSRLSLPAMPRFSFLSKLSKMREKLSDLIPQSVKPTMLAQPKMSKEKILAIVILLSVLLVGGIFWLRTYGNQKRMIAEQQVKLNYAQDLINESVTIGQFDKSKASELLLSAEQKTLEVLNSKYLRGDAVQILDSIQQNRDALDDIKRVKSPMVLVDFSEKRNTVSALGLIALKDRLYGFEYNALYEIVLDKLNDPLTINDLETVILGSAFEEGNSILFLTRTGKMIEYNGSNFSFVQTKDGIWKKGVDMKSYNEKIYILDPERGQIWRYPRKRDGFDAGEQYNQNADLNKAVSLAIDSSVYVLNSDGTVGQMYQGQKQDYPLRRPPLNVLSAPTKIFTNANTNYLYILEPSKQRVVIFRKDPKNGGAQYQTQYVFENIGVMRDLVVADNRLYVIDDKKVYFVNLSGL